MPQIADLESMLEVQNDEYSWEREICGVGVWTWWRMNPSSLIYSLSNRGRHSPR
ncbi:MAG: hypothetical protein ACJAT6_001385 [Akkermansiaceae bacterium]|jgi:hypothetical protein